MEINFVLKLLQVGTVSNSVEQRRESYHYNAKVLFRHFFVRLR